MDHALIRSYHVGLDIGQAADPTALAVVEHVKPELPAELLRQLTAHGDATAIKVARERLPGERFNLLHLERLPLQLAYPLQAVHILQLLAREPLCSNPPRVWLDGTGIGRAIVDLFKQAGLRRMTAVSITSGREVTQREPGAMGVPKIDLIGRLQGALHMGELRIPPTLPEGKTFARELAEFRATVTEAGNLALNARQGQHDDTIIAVALAVWGASQPKRTAVVLPLRI